MIAIDLNGTIKTFSKLPKIWSDENGTHLNITDGEAFGFYPVVMPSTKQSEQLGDIFFDANAEVFTYPVESRTYTQTVVELKEQKIANLKHLYNSELAKTDWYIIRSQEGTAVPQDILDARTTLRTECATHETNINAKTTKASVIDYELPSFI
jgi:hypothetical protein